MPGRMDGWMDGRAARRVLKFIKRPPGLIDTDRGLR